MFILERHFILAKIFFLTIKMIFGDNFISW